MFRVVILGLGLLSAMRASAATFETRPWYGHRVHITLWGKIIEGDNDRFKEEVLKNLRAGYYVTGLSLFTPGGNVPAAMGIGEQVRALEISTISPFRTESAPNGVSCLIGPVNNQVAVTDERCECASACFIIWAAGVNRLGDYVGIHHPYFDKKEYADMDPIVARSKYEPVEREVRAYFSRMQIPEWAVNKMFLKLSKDMYYLSKDELEQMRNPQAFLTEQIYARCGDAPTGSAFQESSGQAWLQCAGKIYEAVARENSKKYLAAGNGRPGEELPPPAEVQPPSPPTPPPPPPRTSTPSLPTEPTVVDPPRTEPDRLVTEDSNYFVRINRDLDGNDTRHIKNVSQSDCAAACDNDFSCHGYSFDFWANYCILKNNITYNRLDTHSISAVKKFAGKFPDNIPNTDRYYWARMEKYPRVYFPGDGYRTTTASNTAECSDICLKETCVAFTYYKNQNQCKLYKSTGKYIRGNDSTDSGVKTQEPN